MQLSKKLSIAAMLTAAAIAGCNSAPPPLTMGQIAALSKADPDMGRVLDVWNGMNPQPFTKIGARDARKQPTLADAQAKLMDEDGKKYVPIEVGGISSMKIPGGDKQDLGLKIYSPKGTGPFPVIVYFHGGGWVVATPDSPGYDATCRELCSMTNAVVVSVDYRRATEDKFPAAHRDCFAAMEWVLQNANQIKGDSHRVVVAGESAGGNMAAAACVMAKDQHAALPIYQLLIYPVAQYGTQTSSYQEFAEARPLDAASMTWFFQQYLPTPDRGYDRDINLNNLSSADLSGLPPAMVITAQIDPLMSEGKTFADHLQQAGVDTKYQNFEGVTHEFFNLSPTVKQAARAEDLATQQLVKVFAATR